MPTERQNRIGDGDRIPPRGRGRPSRKTGRGLPGADGPADFPKIAGLGRIALFFCPQHRYFFVLKFAVENRKEGIETPPGIARKDGLTVTVPF